MMGMCSSWADGGNLLSVVRCADSIIFDSTFPSTEVLATGDRPLLGLNLHDLLSGRTTSSASI
jgi:hypothetical protein